MLTRAVLTLLFLTTIAPVKAQEPLPPPFPRTNATQLLDTARFTVWDIVWPKGQPTAMHRHVNDQVGTYYATGGRVITQPDGQKRPATTEIGSLSTTKKGTTHIEEGTTDPPLRAVFIELKADAPSGLAPVVVAGPPVFPRERASKVLDEPRVTAWDCVWESGFDGFTYRAASETVIVFLGDGTLRTSTRRGTSDLEVKAGTMRHLDRGASEALTVIKGSPRAIFFQLK